MAAQTMKITSSAQVACRDPRCMLIATTIVVEDDRVYAMCDEHAAYYVELAAETVGEAEKALDRARRMGRVDGHTGRTIR